MRRILSNLMMVVLMCVGALCTTVTSTTKIIGPDGQPFNGTLTLQLPFAGVNSVTNQLVLATPVTANVFNGVITPSMAVTGNDVMSPAMPYSALYIDLSGNPVTRQLYYITGTTFDVGSAPATPNFLNTNVLAGTTLTITGVSSLNALNMSGTITTPSSIIIKTAGGTLPATINNDGAGGIQITTGTGAIIHLVDALGNLYIQQPGKSILFFGGTSGFTSLQAVGGIASGSISLPSANGTVLVDVATQSVTGKTLTGASMGNSIELLSATPCFPQGPTASTNGTGASVSIFTCSLLANTVESGKILHIICSGVHDTGTTNVNLALTLNGQSVTSGSTGTVASQSFSMEAYILRTGVTTAQTWGITPNASGVMTPFSVALTGLAFTSNQTLDCEFNVAAGDHITGRVWAPMSIQ